MSDTKKEGKRARVVLIKTDIKARKKAIDKAHSWGQTEKYLRRNRQMWARKASKALRSYDKKVIIEFIETGD